MLNRKRSRSALPDSCSPKGGHPLPGSEHTVLYVDNIKRWECALCPRPDTKAVRTNREDAKEKARCLGPPCVHAHTQVHTQIHAMYIETPLKDALPSGSLLGDNMHMSQDETVSSEPGQTGRAALDSSTGHQRIALWRQWWLQQQPSSRKLRARSRAMTTTEQGPPPVGAPTEWSPLRGQGWRGLQSTCGATFAQEGGQTISSLL